MKKSVFIVGGINADITGTPNKPLVAGDSNIGTVNISAGGVGRNMAENLARMGFNVQLVCAMGTDGYAGMHERDCARLNIKLDHCVRVKGARSSVYMCIMNGSGDMYAAVNNMDVCELLTPDTIPIKEMNIADAVLVDTNIPAETLEYIVSNASVPVFCDPVSTEKGRKLTGLFPGIYAIKPNAAEAYALTGESTPERAALRLIQMGVKRAYVSMGTEGMAFADASTGELSVVEPYRAGKFVNATGAGDSATAALCAGYLYGYTARECALLACRVAAMTVECASAVSEKLNEEILIRRI